MSKPKRIIIVGGVGGGATVAAQIRRQDHHSEILLFDRGNHIAFSNCGLPYYLGNITDRNELLTNTDDFSKKYHVSVQINTEVTFIDPTKKQIHYEKSGETYIQSYDKLILSPGATAVIPELKGLNMDNTFTLHTIPDMDAIHTFIEKEQPQRVAIVGAGFIGLEMVENFRAIGLDCTLINRSDHILKIVDHDFHTILTTHLYEKGVDLELNDGLAAFSNDGKTIHLQSGKTIQTDFTLLAVGIKPLTVLAETAGIQLGETGALAVNAYMQTNDPDIYALGDVVETADFLTETPRHIALAWPAHRQAFIIASHLQGDKLPYDGTMGSAILKLFDLTIGATGHTSKDLNTLEIPYQEAFLSGYSHAGYYPGSVPLHIKILFSKTTGQLYGAQVVGFKGADKRLAVLTTAIKGQLTVHDLAALELAYAPPYSQPKDPINIIGYKAVAKLTN